MNGWMIENKVTESIAMECRALAGCYRFIMIFIYILKHTNKIHTCLIKLVYGVMIEHEKLCMVSGNFKVIKVFNQKENVCSEM